MKEDKINPKHYNDYDYQPLHFLRDVMSDSEFNWFLIGQVVKYVSRHRKKDGKQDLQKALFYLNLVNDVPYIDPTTLSKFAGQLTGRDRMNIHFLFLDTIACKNCLEDTIENYDIYFN